jgi:hypothetical protein
MLQMEWAAVTIQRYARGYLGRVFCRKLRAEMASRGQGPVQEIQRIWRGYWARCQFSNMFDQHILEQRAVTRLQVCGHL